VDLGIEVHELDMRVPVPRRIPALLLTLLALVPLLQAPLARASTELVKNGLFTEGRDGKPDHWRSEGYATDATEYAWAVGDDGLGVLRMTSTKPNDARWVQSVPVSPGTWYQVSGWVRAEDVGAQSLGAYLSVMDTFYNSRDLRGTSGWQQVGFWVKTGSLETSLSLACRLGGYSSLNTGTATCAGLSVVAAGSPRAGDPFVFGGDPASGEASGGLPIARGVAVLVAIGVVLLAWRYLASPAARIPP
jgi:dolichyl-phosphate-mannose-protein mannosyltransferase